MTRLIVTGTRDHLHCCGQRDRYDSPVTAVPDFDLETILLELPAGRQRRPPEPHPELVASIWPTPRQMIEATAVLGWLPSGDLSRGAV